jgi:hypothetical protein
MTTPTKFTAIALIVAAAVAFGIQRSGSGSPADTVNGFIAAIANGDGERALTHLSVAPGRMGEDPAAKLTDPFIAALAGNMRVHGVRTVSTGAEIATVEVDVSHVSVGEAISIVFFAGIASAFTGDQDSDELLAEIRKLPANERSSVTVTLLERDGRGRIAHDARNDEFLTLLAVTLL